MKRFRRSGPIERKLRRDRPQPSETLIQRIADDVSGRPARRPLNLVLAFTLTVALAVAFAMTGGIGYAASAVTNGTTAITHLVSGKGPTSSAKGNSAQSNGQSKGSSNDQYEHKVLICHRPPGNPENARTISVDEHAVPAHLAHGDTLGPCS
jgi:hypothetical protein